MKDLDCCPWSLCSRKNLSQYWVCFSFCFWYNSAGISIDFLQPSTQNVCGKAAPVPQGTPTTECQ